MDIFKNEKLHYNYIVFSENITVNSLVIKTKLFG